MAHAGYIMNGRPRARLPGTLVQRDRVGSGVSARSIHPCTLPPGAAACPVEIAALPGAILRPEDPALGGSPGLASLAAFFAAGRAGRSSGIGRTVAAPRPL
jgi:hypothetical protein